MTERLPVHHRELLEVRLSSNSLQELCGRFEVVFRRQTAEQGFVQVAESFGIGFEAVGDLFRDVGGEVVSEILA